MTERAYLSILKEHPDVLSVQEVAKILRIGGFRVLHFLQVVPVGFDCVTWLLKVQFVFTA